MKTKFYLLGLVTCIFGISYTNATTYNIQGNGENYTPNQITYTNNITLNNYICNDEGDKMGCRMEFKRGEDNEWRLQYEEGEITDPFTDLQEYLEDYEGIIYLEGPNDTENWNTFTTINITAGNNEETPGGNTPTGGSIIEGGINTFTPVISRMLEIAGEFIPYIVYIFIGYLGVILLWNAVKYIIGYLERKSKKTVREINERDFEINFNDESDTRKYIKPTVYKNNYERKKAQEERQKRNQKREDNVL